MDVDVFLKRGDMNAEEHACCGWKINERSSPVRLRCLVRSAQGPGRSAQGPRSTARLWLFHHDLWVATNQTDVQRDVKKVI